MLVHPAKSLSQIPAYGSSLWDSKAIADDLESEPERHSKGKRKKRFSEEGNSRKSKNPKRQGSDTEMGDVSSPPRKKNRTSKREDNDPDGGEPRRKRRKSKTLNDGSEDDDNDDEDEDQTGKRKKGRSRSTSKKLKNRKQSEDESVTASSDSDTGSGGPPARERLRNVSKSRLKSGTSKPIQRSSSPAPFEEYDYENEGPTHVYRAIRPERVASGWSQAPCTACPSFDFCDDKGPVNAKDCAYFGEWLRSATAAAE